MENMIYATKAQEKPVENSFDNLNNVSLNVSHDSKDILEMLFNEYDLIEKIKDDTIDNLIIFKKFLVDYEAIVSAFVSKFNNPKVLDELHKYWDNKRNVIGKLIEGNTDLNPYTELESILNYTNDYYNTLLNSETVNISETKTIDDSKSIDNANGVFNNEFVIPQVDALYSKLYDAINLNDVKKETVYRGRIIRILKKNRNIIENEYSKVKCLDEINNLLQNNFDFNEILKILKREENKNYFDFFSDCISNKEQFINKFNDLYEKEHVKKKSAYNTALRDELKEHGKLLDARFSNEFLEKKGTLRGIVTVLPNALALSARKLGNTIRELKEAKTNKMRVAKSVQVLKDTGKMIATPVVYMGKFLVNNWYALYSIHKGVVFAKDMKTKEEIAKQEEVDAQEKARLEREKIESERQNAIAEDEKRKVQVAKEKAAKQDYAREQAIKSEAEAEAYAKAQEEGRKAAEKREMMDSYNNAVKERAEAEARYHRDAANYTPETSPESAPESNSEPVLDPEEYRDLPNFGNDGRFSVPSINPIFF